MSPVDINFFFSMVLTLIFVIDPFGIIPDYLAILKPYTQKRRRWIVIRELVFALLIMSFFQYVGSWLLTALSLTKTTVQIAGGIVLFLISIRLIFPSDSDQHTAWQTSSSPCVVPIATPLIAGPSALAMIMIFSQEESKHLITFAAIFIAWLISGIILLLAKPLYRFFGDKGMMAIERLTGLIVTLIAVQIFFQGVSTLVHGGR